MLLDWVEHRRNRWPLEQTQSRSRRGRQMGSWSRSSSLSRSSRGGCNPSFTASGGGPWFQTEALVTGVSDRGVWEERSGPASVGGLL